MMRFSGFSYPGAEVAATVVHKPWILLNLTIELGISQLMVWFCRCAECKSYKVQVIDVSTKILEEKFVRLGHV